MVYNTIITCLGVTACMMISYAEQNEFIKQPAQISHQSSRRKLREDLVLIFDEYAHTLLSEIQSLTEILCKGQPISQDIVMVLIQRSETLKDVISFFDQGVMPSSPVISPGKLQSAQQDTDTAIIGNLIGLLVHAEQHILKSIRDILEQSTHCCFIKTRSTPLLHEYCATAYRFQQASIEHVKKLQKYYNKPTTLTKLNTKEHEHGVV